LEAVVLDWLVVGEQKEKYQGKTRQKEKWE
jgi:hypothetical protein